MFETIDSNEFVSSQTELHASDTSLTLHWQRIPYFGVDRRLSRRLMLMKSRKHKVAKAFWTVKTSLDLKWVGIYVTYTFSQDLLGSGCLCILFCERLFEEDPLLDCGHARNSPTSKNPKQWACQSLTSVAAILLLVSEILFCQVGGFKKLSKENNICSGDYQCTVMSDKLWEMSWPDPDLIWGGANQVTHRRRPPDLWGELQQSWRCSRAKKCYEMICNAHLYVRNPLKHPRIPSPLTATESCSLPKQ